MRSGQIRMYCTSTHFKTEIKSTCCDIPISNIIYHSYGMNVDFQEVPHDCGICEVHKMKVKEWIFLVKRAARQSCFCV